MSQIDREAIKFTIIKSISPLHLSKRYYLNEQGVLQKMRGGNMTEGECQIITVSTMVDLATRLDNLDSSQAVTWGLPPVSSAKILTKRKLGSQAEKNEHISRTAKYFKFAEKKPGILMLDYDPEPGKKKLSAEELLKKILEICPEIENSAYLVRPSASSFIYAEDGREFRGASGWRVLVAVSDAGDIPRAGDVFLKKCWLAGDGYIKISDSGGLLVRSLVDGVVWQAERLDFCGGAYCVAPLVQRFPLPIINEGILLDSHTALPDLSEEDALQVKALIAAEKARIAPETQEKKNTWIATQVEKIVSKNPHLNDEARTALAEKFKRAVMDGILLGDFELLTEFDEAVTVGDILANPKKYHMARFYDPLEPDYPQGHADKRIARAYLYTAGKPYIYSFHGSRRFFLKRVLKEICVQPGERMACIDKALNLARLDCSLFERNEELVKITENGMVLPLDSEKLLNYLDRLACWTRFDSKTKKVPCDCPITISKGVLSEAGSWHLPKLKSVISTPILDVIQDRLIDQEGYDEKCQVYYFPDRSHKESNIPPIPDKPTMDEVKKALEVVWFPFKDFPFRSSLDRAVFLAAILTAVVRPLLPGAPGFLFSAPCRGSGKTLLALCVAVLSGDARPAVSLMPTGRDSKDVDNELRKKLAAHGRGGEKTIILDNIEGILRSNALCAFFTNDVNKDRILGATAEVYFYTNSLALFTGNNVILYNDLCRRILTCIIDAQVERPDKRSFSFHPKAYCEQNRLKIVHSALILLRAGLQNGTKPPGDPGGFEVWSESVRKAVIWLGTQGIMELTDPFAATDASVEDDPEIQKLDRALSAIFALHSSGWLVADLVGTTELFTEEDPLQEEKKILQAVLLEIAGEGKNINARRLGRWIAKYNNQIINGKKFIKGRRSNRGQEWQVVDVTKNERQKKINESREEEQKNFF